MTSRTLSKLILIPLVALAACGSSKPVNAATYTCAQYNKSLNTKGDDSAGNFINQLSKQAKLGKPDRVEHNEVAAGIFFACRNKPGSTRPAARAVAIAKAINSGKYHLKPAPKKKKSGQQSI